MLNPSRNLTRNITHISNTDTCTSSSLTVKPVLTLNMHVGNLSATIQVCYYEGWIPGVSDTQPASHSEPHHSTKHMCAHRAT